MPDEQLYGDVVKSITSGPKKVEMDFDMAVKATAIKPLTKIF